MAHLLIIELPGGNDCDIIDAAVRRRDHFTFLSAELGHYQAQPEIAAALALARHTIEVSPFDYAQVEARILALHANDPIDAVLCLLDLRLVEAARLAESLGTRFLNPASAVVLRDKYSVRRALQDAGIAQPDFRLATSNQDLRQAVDELGLPVLIKPVDGYGSQNIVVLRDALELDPLLTPLNDMLPSGAKYGLGVLANDRLIVERFMAGAVIGCDTLSANGRHLLLGKHEKAFYPPPSFAIRGGCFTPNTGQMAEVERYVTSVLSAVGFDWGAAHTEIMLTADGPRLIEINPRLVGAKIGRLVGHALGCSIHEELIGLHLGLSDGSAHRGSGDIAVSRWLCAERSGTLRRVTVPAVDDPRIRCVEVMKRSGDHVRAPIQNADRLGYVMVTDPNRAAAEALAESFIGRCRCELLS